VAVTQSRFDVSRLARSPSTEKMTVTVLAGGPSGERDISLQSGAAVSAALLACGHEVHVEDIAPDDLKALARDVDCVFIALHGRFGEDGQVQAILEKRGLAYTGSGPDACALAMNKALAKARFVDLGLPTPRYAVGTAESVRATIAAWSLPVVVKPVKEGSSLNCHIVREFEQFRPAVEDVVGHYRDCLVEEYIPGKEITVGILGDQALPPLEIRSKNAFYDYHAKYVADDTEYDFDIDLPASVLDEIVEMSLRAHRGLDCRDFSRVDWRVDTDRMQAFLLEVNVVPGLTTHSLVPKAAERVGVSMSDLCQYLIDAAARRHISKQRG